MSNIVLIGATGNIGSRILDEALARKHSVTAITRDPRKLTRARRHDGQGREHDRRAWRW